MADENTEFDYFEHLIGEMLKRKFTVQEREEFVELATNSSLDEKGKAHLEAFSKRIKEYIFKAIDEFCFAKFAKIILENDSNEEALLDKEDANMLNMQFGGAFILYVFELNEVNLISKALQEELDEAEFTTMQQWQQVLKSLNKDEQLVAIYKSTELTTSERLSRFEKWWKANKTAQELERILDKSKKIIKSVLKSYPLEKALMIRRKGSQLIPSNTRVMAQTNEITHYQNASGWFKQSFQQIKGEIDKARKAYDESLQKFLNLQKGE